MPTAQQLHDRAVVHRVWLGRYSNGFVRRVLAQLSRVEDDVLTRVATSRGTTQAALSTLLASVQAVQTDGWGLVAKVVEADVAGLTGAELAFQGNLMALGASQVGVALTESTLSVANVVAAVKARPFQGKLLREWLADFDDASKRRVREAIRQGFAENESIDQIVRRLRGTNAVPGVLAKNRLGAEAMVRTAVTHTANTAAHETYRAAEDLLDGVEWVSTLDSRTTIICAKLDGKVFPLDKGPRPPAHINCRSTTIARLKGMAPFKRTTYADWIKSQPVAIQNEVLGVKRATLLRSGRMKLDRFVDNHGHVLTLDELRRKDAAAFAEAA